MGSVCNLDAKTAAGLQMQSELRQGVVCVCNKLILLLLQQQNCAILAQGLVNNKNWVPQRHPCLQFFANRDQLFFYELSECVDAILQQIQQTNISTYLVIISNISHNLWLADKNYTKIVWQGIVSFTMIEYIHNSEVR